MATSQKNLQIEKAVIDFYNEKFDGKGTAGMQDTLSTIAMFMPNHPIELTRNGLIETLEYIISASKAIACEPADVQRLRAFVPVLEKFNYEPEKPGSIVYGKTL